jgi:FkbM family methyltransferase
MTADLPAPTEAPKRPLLFVSTLVGGGRLFAQHADCCEQLRTACAQEGIDLYIARNGGTGVDRARNRECARFLSLSAEPRKEGRACYWLQLDDDVLFDPKDIVKMIRSGLEVTAMVYPRKEIDWSMVADAVKRGIAPDKLAEYASSFIVNGVPQPGTASVAGLEVEADGQLIGTFMEVAEVGTGCLMVRREVIERYIEAYGPEIAYRTDYPPIGEVHYGVFMCEVDSTSGRGKAAAELLRAARSDDPDGESAIWKAVVAYNKACNDDSTLGRYATEDWSFCNRWRAIGGKVHVFMDGSLVHLGGYAYRGNVRRSLGLKVTEVTLKYMPPEHAGVQTVLAGAYDVPGLSFDRAPVILDIGANIGAFTVWAANRWPGAKLEAYEPHPEHVRLLLENTDGIPNVDAFMVAINGAAKAGQAMLFDGKNNPGERSLHQLGEQVMTGMVVNTMPAADLPPCDILKIDTEGCEVEILETYPYLSGVKALMLEWHRDEDFQKLMTWLPTLGFELSTGTWAPDRNLIFVRGMTKVVEAAPSKPGARECIVCGHTPAPHVFDHGDDGPYCSEHASPGQLQASAP